MTDLPRSAALSLYALSVAEEFAVWDNNILAIRVGDKWAQLHDADIVALHERALISFDEDDPEDGTPRNINLTWYGQDFLRRWMAINKHPLLVFTQPQPVK